jgi:hypothetical protein
MTNRFVALGLAAVVALSRCMPHKNPVSATSETGSSSETSNPIEFYDGYIPLKRPSKMNEHMQYRLDLVNSLGGDTLIPPYFFKPSIQEGNVAGFRYHAYVLGSSHEAEGAKFFIDFIETGRVPKTGDGDGKRLVLNALRADGQIK